jgi:quinol monooxygenase YgiN
MTVKATALVTVKPGCDDAFVAAATACAAASRAEPGVLHYELWRDVEQADRFVFNELYVDDEAVQQHMASAHFHAFSLAARDLAAARPTIIVSHPVDLA